MILLESYVLRADTRPNAQEALQIIDEILKTYFPNILERNCKNNVSNITQPGQRVGEHIHKFIIFCGGEKYLKNPQRYEVQIFECESGFPWEETCVAFIFQKDITQENQIPIMAETVKKALERGQRWEQSERWADAIQCYRSCLMDHPDHQELMFRLGCAQTHFVTQLVDAINTLKRVYDNNSNRADYAFGLASAYIQLIDHPEIPVRGLNREELKKKVKVLLYRAVMIEPSNEIYRQERDKMCSESNNNNVDLFFNK